MIIMCAIISIVQTESVVMEHASQVKLVINNKNIPIVIGIPVAKAFMFCVQAVSSITVVIVRLSAIGYIIDLPCWLHP